MLVELFHQFCSRLIVYFPQTGQNARSAGIHEPSDHAHETLTLDFLAESGVARAEHDELGSKLQVVHIAQSEISALRISLFVDQRQHEAGEIWMIVVLKPYASRNGQS